MNFDSQLSLHFDSSWRKSILCSSHQKETEVTPCWALTYKTLSLSQPYSLNFGDVSAFLTGTEYKNSSSVFQTDCKNLHQMPPTLLGNANYMFIFSSGILNVSARKFYFIHFFPKSLKTIWKWWEEGSETSPFTHLR